MTAMRLGKPVAQCGYELAPNAEQHLRSRLRLANLYPEHALAETLSVAGALHFFAGRAAIRISRRARAARRHARGLSAAGNVDRCASAVSRTASRTRCRSRSSTNCADPRARVRAVFPDGVRHRALRAQPAHPVPGPRLGGQLRGLLLPGRHRSRSRARQHAVRALHQQGAQRAARHRRRFRAPAARRGDPVHLRKVRPRPRGARGRCHHLPAA